MNLIERVSQSGRHVCSYLFPWLVEQRVGGISPFLEVWLIDGKYHLNTQKANYSFGSLHTVFSMVFNKRNIKERNPDAVLMLGFGTGSVASILQEEYQMSCKITAVDKDPVVIELGHKYFNIDRFKDLKVICEDGYDFVQRCQDTFDLIVVDIFVDLDVPSCFNDELFLQALNRLLSDKGTLFFNKIPYSSESIVETDVLHERLKKIFRYTEVDKVTIENTGNWVFVCEK